MHTHRSTQHLFFIPKEIAPRVRVAAGQLLFLHNFEDRRIQIKFTTLTQTSVFREGTEVYSNDCASEQHIYVLPNRAIKRSVEETTSFMTSDMVS
jgi:hypothetical protein